MAATEAEILGRHRASGIPFVSRRICGLFSSLIRALLSISHCIIVQPGLDLEKRQEPASVLGERLLASKAYARRFSVDMGDGI